MVQMVSSSMEEMARRRGELGMSCAALAARSGVSEPTVKRILGGRGGEASFANVAAIAEALGMGLRVEAQEAERFREAQARKQAERIARLIQGTSALESQGVDAATYARLVERTYHELLAGSGRKLWGE